jgi:hypothetical protein
VILLLYLDKLVHVHSQAIRWGTSVGLLVAPTASAALTQSGLGALGTLMGAAIARSQAAGRAAVAGGVTVILLVSITGRQTKKSAGMGGWLGGQAW